jgi:hypothetical protein
MIMIATVLLALVASATGSPVSQADTLAPDAKTATATPASDLSVPMPAAAAEASATPTPAEKAPAVIKQFKSRTGKVLSADMVWGHHVRRQKAGAVGKQGANNDEEWWSCFSEYLYATLCDTMAATEDTVNNAMSGGGTAVTIITLILILLASLLLLFLGARLVKAAVLCLTSFVSFLVGLEFYLWVCGGSTSSFVVCWLPFILALITSIIVVALTRCFIEKFESLAMFIVGACGGAMGMYILRAIIVAADPSLAASPSFQWYWVGLAAVAIIAGFAAVFMKTAILVSVTSIVGAYGLAVSILGLIPACGGSWTWPGAFWLILCLGAPLGMIVQCYVSAKDSDGDVHLKK